VDSNIVYGNISYSARNQPVAPIRSPSVLFSTVFGTGGTGGTSPSPTVDNGPLYQKSVLDLVKGRIQSLSQKLGTSDRIRLDAHLTSIRELEGRIATVDPQPAPAPAPQCSSATAPSSTSGFTARANALIDVLALALVCNRTRVASFMLTNAAGNEDASSASVAGQSQGHHAAAHAGDGATITGFSTFYLTFAARLLDRSTSSRALLRCSPTRWC
jgi:hypothetical protein